MLAAEFFRTRMSSMIANGFAVETVRDGLDFAGVSEFWGGPAYDDRPAWYFWLTNMRGAYQLRLQKYESVLEEPLFMGVVGSIKYYPSPLEPVFRYFSQQERRWIRTTFDETRTPKHESAEAIPEHLFQVGSFRFLRDFRQQQSFLEFATDSTPAHLDSTLASHLPAWDLGYPLFDSLVGLESFLSRKAPKRVILELQNKAENQAFKDEAKRVLVIFSAETSRNISTLEAALVDAATSKPFIADYDCECQPTSDFSTAISQHGRYEKPRFHKDVSFHTRPFLNSPTEYRSRHIHLSDPAWKIPLAFNALWWTLSQAKTEGAKLSCCCH